MSGKILTWNRKEKFDLELFTAASVSNLAMPVSGAETNNEGKSIKAGTITFSPSASEHQTRNRSVFSQAVDFACGIINDPVRKAAF